MPTLLSHSTRKALTTLARAKAFLGISNDAQDDRLIVIINQVTGFIERYTKRSLLRQTYTSEVYDGNGTPLLILKQFPVASVSSLQYRNTDDRSSDDWTTIPTSDYFWFADGRIKLAVGSFKEVSQKYRVTYAAGYLIDFDNENTPASHTLPEELEYACHKLTSAILNTRRAEGLAQESQGDQSVQLKAQVMNDPETRAILDKYAAPTI